MDKITNFRFHQLYSKDQQITKLISKIIKELKKYLIELQKE